MAWHRHQGDSKFHAGAPGSGSFVTLCNGRWPLSDEARGEVEHDASPPHDERCDNCQRQAIDVTRINRGLRELAEWPFDFSDVVGGEA